MRDELVFMNEYDDVLVNYKGNDFDELVGMISDDDINEMRAYVEACDWSYEDVRPEDLKYAVVYNYTQELLIECIREGTAYGTSNLLRLVNEVM